MTEPSEWAKASALLLGDDGSSSDEEMKSGGLRAAAALAMRKATDDDTIADAAATLSRSLRIVSWRRDDRVQVLFQKTWVSARILGPGTKGYDVRYDEGTIERAVPLSRIRKPTDATQKIPQDKPRDDVEAAVDALKKKVQAKPSDDVEPLKKTPPDEDETQVKPSDDGDAAKEPDRTEGDDVRDPVEDDVPPEEDDDAIAREDDHVPPEDEEEEEPEVSAGRADALAAFATRCLTLEDENVALKRKLAVQGTPTTKKEVPRDDVGREERAVAVARDAMRFCEARGAIASLAALEARSAADRVSRGRLVARLEAQLEAKATEHQRLQESFAAVELRHRRALEAARLTTTPTTPTRTTDVDKRRDLETRVLEAERQTKILKEENDKLKAQLREAHDRERASIEAWRAVHARESAARDALRDVETHCQDRLRDARRTVENALRHASACETHLNDTLATVRKGKPRRRSSSERI